MAQRHLKDDILRLRAQGKSYREIGAELDCSRSIISYHCGPGQKEKAKDRKRIKTNLKRRYVQDYKEARGCMDCGNMYPYYMLDLDHLSDKVENVGKMVAWVDYTLEAVVAEVAKCEVVCANCHRVRTWNRAAA